MADRYELTACDIHEKAIEFLTSTLQVESLLSRSDPHDFAVPRKFDIVFALSFFSHMPDRTWGAWFARLFDALADDGLLVFTTHGRVVHEDGGRPPLEPDGYWFGGTSEQRDLPVEDYRTMIVTPFYAFKCIEQSERAALVFFQEALWWGKQDTYIVRKVPVPFRRFMQVLDPARYPALPAALLESTRILPDRSAALALWPTGAVIAQVGVALGEFSTKILAVCRPCRLLAIDRSDLHALPVLSGRPTRDHFDDDSTHVDFERDQFANQIADGQVEVIPGDRTAAIAQLPNSSVDVFFVHSNHSYDGVRRDLAALVPKVKPDGWIVMKDYIAADVGLSSAPYGVIQATNEFMIEQGWAMDYFAFAHPVHGDVGLRKVAFAGSRGLEALRSYVADLETALTITRRSTSWRITAPLRAIGRALGR
jgi:SAM-dependent methyltransferase